MPAETLPGNPDSPQESGGTIKLPYRARIQFMPYHRRTQRWAVMVVHRQGGKTVAVINDLILNAVACKRPSPRFAYICPYLKQSKDIAWDYLRRYTAKIPGIKPSESELSVTLPGDRRIRLYGADNPDALRGIYLDGVVFDESDDMDPSVWMEIVFPMLSTRSGWGTWIGTLKRRGSLYRMLGEAQAKPDEWFSLILRASESKLIPEDELVQQKNGMEPAMYAREMECDLSMGVAGAIYGPQMGELFRKKRITVFEQDRAAPLFTSWDIGGGTDYTSIWLLQMVGMDICALDFLCRVGQPPSWYVDQMRVWESGYGRPIAHHFLPHDANSVGPSGKSFKGYLADYGLRNTRVVQRTPNVWLGINHLRTLLPRFFIHSGRCSQQWRKGEKLMPSGIECLEGYHSKEESMGTVSKEVPIHDEYSHGADAMRTFAEAHMLGMIDNRSIEERMEARSGITRSVKLARPNFIRGRLNR